MAAFMYVGEIRWPPSSQCIGYLEDISHLGVLKQYKKTIWTAGMGVCGLQ